MKLREISTIFFSLFMGSCAVRSVYVPVSPQVPLFDKEKQIHAVGYLGYNNVQLQIASNPLPHFLCGVNNMLGAGHSTYEGMVGYFHSGGEKANWRYETQMGAGHTENYTNVDLSWLSRIPLRAQSFEAVASYNTFFVQPAVGYFGKIPMYKLKFSFAFSTRVSYLDYSHFSYSETPGNADPAIEPFKRQYDDPSMFLLEPCITNKVERNNLAFVIQFIRIIPYSQQIDVRNMPISPVFFLSTGLQYRLVFKKRHS